MNSQLRIAKPTMRLRLRPSICKNAIAAQGWATALVAVIAIFSVVADAIPESDYEQNYQQVIRPFITTHAQIREFDGQDGIKINTVSYVQPAENHSSGNVVVLPGYDESTLKYAELAHDLFQKGYSVYLLDHRGQGASGRFLADSQKAHIDHFENLVLDLKTFIDQFVPENSSATPRFLLAHSLGGAVAALYLETYPRDFAAAALSCPMLSINLGQPEWLVSIEAWLLNIVGQSNHYVPGSGPFDPLTSPNLVSQSPARYEHNEQILKQHPELFVAGPTTHWLSEALHGSQKARENGALAAAPILLFQAGHDAYVLPAGQDLFCRQAPNCKLQKLASAHHEILQENDPIRDQVLSQIFTFFKNHRSNSSLAQESAP